MAVEQTPLCTTASNSVVAVSGPVFNGLAVEAMAVQLLPPFTEYCHPTIIPVCPLKLIVVLLTPSLHISGLPADAVPPTDGWSTVTVAGLEMAVEQTPLCTTASNSIVAVSDPVFKGLAVEAMAVQVFPPSVEYCHPTIAPVCPFKLIVVLLTPSLHISGLPANVVPPTDAASTVTVATVEVAGGELAPFCTTASNSVVAVSGPVFNGLAVEAMAVQLLPPFTEYCHPTIAPVCPLKLIVVLLTPSLHISGLPADAVPPTDNAGINKSTMV
jgi:hypothetical protein